MENKPKFSIVENIHSTKVRAMADEMRNAKLYKERAQLKALPLIESGEFEKHLKPIALENQRQATLLIDVMDTLYSKFPDMSVVVGTLYISLIDILATMSEDDKLDVRLSAMTKLLAVHMEQMTEWVLDVVEASAIYDTLKSIEEADDVTS